VVAVGTPATLSGAGSSSPGSEPLGYLWKLLEFPEGSSYILTDSTSAEFEVIPDQSGTYRFSLVVNNGSDTSIADEVTVMGSLPPVAVAGRDTSVSVDEMYVRIDGSNSYDPEGDELSYAWELATAPDESEKIIYEAESQEVILKSDVEGVFILVLRVSDGPSVSEPDTVVVTVLAHGTGTGRIDHPQLVTLYPNPSSGRIDLKVPGQEAIHSIEILDLKGQILEVIEVPYNPEGHYRIELDTRLLNGSMVICRIIGRRLNEEHLLLIQY
jgi:hypothetical protein